MAVHASAQKQSSWREARHHGGGSDVHRLWHCHVRVGYRCTPAVGQWRRLLGQTAQLGRVEVEEWRHAQRLRRRRQGTMPLQCVNHVDVRLQRDMLMR